jgi:multiple sugar transport system ATP-binding protein
MVFQSYALYPHMSVYDIMGFALKLARAPQSERDRKVHVASRILQMDDLLDPKPAQLSSGPRHRPRVCGVPVRRTLVQPGCQAARADAA